MVNYKQNFINAVDYAAYKTKYSYWKLILLGIMGSVYVGLGYIVFIYILSKGQDWDAIYSGTKDIHISGAYLALAAALFPIGLLLIIFLGGSLFTSDNLTSLAILTKKAKIAPVVVKWGLTLAGNIIGAFIIAAIVRLGGIFSNKDLLLLSSVIHHKVILQWYNVLFSGLLCNILVAGTVWATLATKHSIAKIFLIYFPIWLFAIAGFQHVVANSILFAFGWLHGDTGIFQHLGALPVFKEGFIGDFNHIESWKAHDGTGMGLGDWTFYAVFANLIPAMIGNWISGSIILPLVYFYLSESNVKIKLYKQNGCKVCEDTCLSHLEDQECYFRTHRLGNHIQDSAEEEIIKKKAKFFKSKNSKK